MSLFARLGAWLRPASNQRRRIPGLLDYLRSFNATKIHHPK